MSEKIYANRANYSAIDHLGRALPTAEETGARRPEKIVALFYYLWLGYHGTQGPYDISKILEADPEAMHKPDSPLWPPSEHTPMMHWGSLCSVTTYLPTSGCCADMRKCLSMRVLMYCSSM